MRPLIGITTDHTANRHGQPITELTEAYSRAIVDAGGVPVLIPSLLDRTAIRGLFARLDGIVFSGGGDIEPRRYGVVFDGRLIGVYPARDELELELLHFSIDGRKPFLGICRGCQLVNVGLGGTLHPHLPSDPGGPIKHDRPGNERDVLAHQVTIESGSRLGTILDSDEVWVNSHHHQGLHRIASGLRVAGSAPDGLVEAVEAQDHPFGMAVQWHPEWLTNQPRTRSLFRAFVEAAAGSR